MENLKHILLSTAYLGPIQYFSKIAHFDKIVIEQHEHFIKQTFRNRAIILGANGPIPLVMPVVKGRAQKIPIKDLRIAYDEDWQRNHWRTIFSAYNSSPFFEYYADEIKIYYEKKYKYLLDFNTKITSTILELLELEPEPVYSDSYQKILSNGLDLRNSIHPKQQKQTDDPNFKTISYTQVFSEKFGFVPNLSILDLLFNKGSESTSLLLESFLENH